MSDPFAPAPGAVVRSDINKLMLYHDRQFVDLAYRLILGRQSDDEGRAHYLGRLRAGESRREIAFGLASSPEAREKGVDQRLFASYRIWRRIERIPVLGAFLLLIICAVRIRRIIREFRRLQNAVFGGLLSAAVTR